MKTSKSFSIEVEFLEDVLLQLSKEAEKSGRTKPETLSEAITELLKSRFAKSKETRRNAAAKRLAQIVATVKELKVEEKEVLRYMSAEGGD